MTGRTGAPLDGDHDDHDHDDAIDARTRGADDPLRDRDDAVDAHTLRADDLLLDQLGAIDARPLSAGDPVRDRGDAIDGPTFRVADLLRDRDDARALRAGDPLRDRDDAIDAHTLRADDLLLDQLGRGEEPAGDAGVVATLATWRATLPDATPVDDELLDAALAAVRPATRGRRVARTSAVVSIAALLVGATVTAAAEQAGPDSPLWPVTQFVFQDLADSRAAAHAAGGSIDAARAAIDDGRYAEANRLLDDAATFAAAAGRREDASRLNADIAALRARIPADRQEPAGGSAGDPVGDPPSPGVPVPPAPSLADPLPTVTVTVEPGRPSVSVTGGPAVPPVVPTTVEIAPPLGSVLPPVGVPLIDTTIGLGR